MAHNSQHEKLASLPTLDTNFEKRPLSTSSDDSSSSSSIVETPVKQPEPVVHKKHHRHHHHHRDSDGKRRHHHHNKKHRSKRVKDTDFQSPISEKFSAHSSLSTPVLDLEDPQNQPNLYEDPAHITHGNVGAANGAGGGGAMDGNAVLGLGPPPRRSFLRRHGFLIFTSFVGLVVVGILAGVVVYKFAILPNQHRRQYIGGTESNWDPASGAPVWSIATTTTPTPTPTPIASSTAL